MMLISRYLAFCFLTIVFAEQLPAQEIHIRDSIIAYDNYRIRINYIGSMALGTWGAANAIYGGIESCLHHGTDAYPYQVATAFGILNTGISVVRYLSIVPQLQHSDSYQATLVYYKNDKRFFIGSILSDMVITGGGLVLMEKNSPHTPDFWQAPGTARAICLQGLVRLFFDNAMWIAHYHNNSKWYDIVSDMQFMGTEVGIRYQINPRRHNGL